MTNKIIDGNQSFVSLIENDSSLKEKLAKLAKEQTPYALIITCSDSRVVPETIFNCGLGELFVIRTAGNVINEGELASVEYGIEHLHIPLVVVLGHTHCGAVHASIKKEEGKYLRPILSRIQLNIGDTTDECEASKINAIKEVEYIKSKFPSYDGTILPMLYDIETGKVSIL